MFRTPTTRMLPCEHFHLQSPQKQIPLSTLALFLISIQQTHWVEIWSNIYSGKCTCNQGKEAHVLIRWNKSVLSKVSKEVVTILSSKTHMWERSQYMLSNLPANYNLLEPTIVQFAGNYGHIKEMLSLPPGKISFCISANMRKYAYNISTSQASVGCICDIYKGLILKRTL